jgi:hypothetical protein
VPVAYDDNGNLTSRTDARGAVTTMTYDALNQKTFSGAPGKCGSLNCDVSATLAERGCSSPETL